GNLATEQEVLVLVIGDWGRTVDMIQVEPEAEVLSHVKSETDAVRFHLIDTVDNSDDNADSIAIGKVLVTAAGHDVEWSEDLLRDRAGESGLQVVGLRLLVRVLHVARGRDCKPRRAEDRVRQVDRRGEAPVFRQLRRGTKIAVADRRAAFD